MKKLKKTISLLFLTVLLSATLISPAQAYTTNTGVYNYYFYYGQFIGRYWFPAPQPTPAPKPASVPTPTPNPTPTPAPSSGYTLSQFEQRVVDLVNLERQKAGLKPLVADIQLSKGARVKSQDMIDENYFSHTSPKYGSPFDMMKTFGISHGYAGENIAAGQTTPEAVVTAWMNSAGHRANILNANYGKIGVGYAYGPNSTYKHYWTQWFTN